MQLATSQFRFMIAYCACHLNMKGGNLSSLGSLADAPLSLRTDREDTIRPIMNAKFGKSIKPMIGHTWLASLT